MDDDDAYYDEVRQAVGHGAPTVLLGTSTKSLNRNLNQLVAVRRAAISKKTAVTR